MFTALRASFSAASEQSHEVLPGYLSTLALDIESIDKRTRSLQTSNEEILHRVSKHEMALQESPDASVPGINAIAEKAEALQVVREKLLSQLEDCETTLKETLDALTAEVSTIGEKAEALAPSIEVITKETKALRTSQ